MADFLGGLLSGGGGLYDDLLTPQQRDQLSSRGLLSMAGAFADAAMPSRFPVPLGAALGKAAAAMSGGRDEAALRLLQGQKLSEEVQTMKARSALEQLMMKEVQTMTLPELLQRWRGAGGVPAAAPSVVPQAAPAVPARPAAAPTTAPLPPAAAALPGTPEASAALFGGDSAAGEYGVGQYDVGKGISPPPARAAVLPSLDSPITPAERLAWQKTVGPGATYLPVEDWVAQQRARVPAGGPSAQPPDAPPGAGSSLNDRYGGILAMAGGEGGASGSSLPPPDELIRQGGGPGGLLQAGYKGAPPFGAGGDEVGSGASVPAGTRYNMPMLRNLAESVGFKGQDADTMAATWMGESGGNPFAKKVDAREASYGLAQINARAHPGGEQAYGDPDYAARKSYDLYQKSKARGGSGFGDWSIYNSGAYKQFLPGGGQAAGGGAPDELVGAGRGVPGFTRAQYSGGGAAPGATGGAPPAAAGGDGQGMNTLLLELAKRNAMAEILKLGNPYSSMLSVLQGSPEYQGQIEAAKRGAGLPFIAPEKAAERSVTEPSDIRIATWKAALDAANEEKKQKLTTLNTLTKTTVPDGKGGVVEVDATVAQAIDIAHGLPVPELGVRGMFGPGGTAATAAPVGKPVLRPGQIKSEEAAATNTQTRLNNYREAADAAASAKTTLQGISGEIGKVVTGPFADYAQNASLYLNTIAPGFSGQVKAYEDMASQANELVRKAVRASDPNPSFVQTRMAMDSMPIPTKSEGGLYKITNRMIGLQDHDIARGNATQMETPGGAEKFDSWWRQNVSPYAFVFAKLAPDDRDSLINTLQKTAQGKRELETIGKQLQFIEQHGGFGVR